MRHNPAAGAIVCRANSHSCRVLPPLVANSPPRRRGGRRQRRRAAIRQDNFDSQLPEMSAPSAPRPQLVSLAELGTKLESTQLLCAAARWIERFGFCVGHARRPPPAPRRRSPHGPDAGLHDPERSAADPRAVGEPQLARRAAEAMVRRARDGSPGVLARPQQGRGGVGKSANSDAIRPGIPI
jgi:hypothetical protein